MRRLRQRSGAVQLYSRQLFCFGGSDFAPAQTSCFPDGTTDCAPDSHAEHHTHRDSNDGADSHTDNCTTNASPNKWITIVCWNVLLRVTLFACSRLPGYQLRDMRAEHGYFEAQSGRTDMHHQD